MENEPKISESTSYSVQIGEHLFERIDKHVQLLKFLGSSPQNKKNWIISAIKEKLKKVGNIPVQNLPKEKHLTLVLDPQLRNEIEEQITNLKKVRRSYSMKQLIVEAIFEQLAQEEDLIKKRVKEKVHRD